MLLGNKLKLWTFMVWNTLRLLSIIFIAANVIIAFMIELTLAVTGAWA